MSEKKETLRSSPVQPEVRTGSRYGLPKFGRCESFQCDNTGKQCKNQGDLVRLLKGTTKNENLNDGHWEQYSCDIAKQIDRDNGFDVILVYPD